MSDEVVIECKILGPNGKVPTKALPNDAGYDIYAGETVWLEAGLMTRVHTEIAVSVPAGYYISIKGRSSLSLQNIDVFGGTLDATYSGELQITMINNDDGDKYILRGDRIAQIIVHKCEPTSIKVIEEFSSEYRGRDEKGWGSSGT